MTEFELTFEIYRYGLEPKTYRMSVFADEWMDMARRADEWVAIAERKCIGHAVLVGAEIVGKKEAA